jgi:hypothetical protein
MDYLTIGIGITAAVLLALAAMLKEHPAYKLLLVFVVLNLLPVLALNLLNQQNTQSCQPVIDTITSSIDTSTYNYVDYCRPVVINNSVAQNFFNITQWVLRLSYGYTILYFIYWFFVLRLNKVLSINDGGIRLERK